MTDSNPDLPLILEPEALERHLGQKELLVVDLSKASTYMQFHVPGAVHLDYGSIIETHRPASGLLPSLQNLQRVFSALGMTTETHIVAYDDEGGGKAARLLWTLEVLGHNRMSLLNGCLHAWANEGHPLERGPTQPEPAGFEGQIHRERIADKDYILANLGNPKVIFLDCRSPQEYRGEKRFSAQGGHIPGALNWDWVLSMDQSRNLRLRPEAELREGLAQTGVSADKEIVTYCQTHHRSSHTYIMLRSLGFERVKGYPGSWSEWGNDPDLPTEL